jgi:hypothetical protein
MRLEPFLSVDGVPFTASREDIIRLHGQPRGEVRNDVGLTALDYGDVVFRFQDCGRLEEVTRQVRALDLGVMAVPFASLKAFVRQQDGEAFERAGFLISPAFGIAFVPEDSDGGVGWVTALARHAIAQWMALRPTLPGPD